MKKRYALSKYTHQFKVKHYEDPKDVERLVKPGCTYSEGSDQELIAIFDDREKAFKALNQYEGGFRFGHYGTSWIDVEEYGVEEQETDDDERGEDPDFYDWEPVGADFCPWPIEIDFTSRWGYRTYFRWNEALGQYEYVEENDEEE